MSTTDAVGTESTCLLIIRVLVRLQLARHVARSTVGIGSVRPWPPCATGCGRATSSWIANDLLAPGALTVDHSRTMIYRVVVSRGASTVWMGD
jgi:hypothetical protein